MSEPKLSAIAPILQIADLDRSIDFWKRVMAFDVAWIAGGEPPKIASVCRDQIYLMVRVEKQPQPCCALFLAAARGPLANQRMALVHFRRHSFLFLPSGRWGRTP